MYESSLRCVWTLEYVSVPFYFPPQSASKMNFSTLSDIHYRVVRANFAVRVIIIIVLSLYSCESCMNEHHRHRAQ